jgi:glycosyltransferase involved in cell wall biosynthesis
MADTPVVSVIVPTYNRAHVLGRAIRSVLDQTYPNLELVVVDDGSSDDTEDVVQAFGDARISYLRHDANRGGSAARNTGIRAAAGDYLAFQDSDDEWLPDKLSRQLEVFATAEDERLGLVTCGLIDLRGREQRVLLPRPAIWTRELFLTFECVPHGTPSLLVRLSAFPERVLFDERLPANQDWDYVFRLMEHCTVACVPHPLFRAHRASTTHVSTGANRSTARSIFLEKYTSELSANPRLLALHHRQLGFYLAKSGDLASARRHLWRAVRADPKEPRSYAWSLGAVFGRLGLRASERLIRPRRVTAKLVQDLQGRSNEPARLPESCVPLASHR